MPIQDTDGVKVVTPPALYLREPVIEAPLPFDPDNPWTLGLMVGRIQEFGGRVAGLLVSGVMAGMRLSGINDETRPAWPRRKGIFGLLTLGAHREWMN